MSFLNSDAFGKSNESQVFFSRSKVMSVKRVLVLKQLLKKNTIVEKKQTKKKQRRMFTFNADALYHYLMQLPENLFVCHLSC